MIVDHTGLNFRLKFIEILKDPLIMIQEKTKKEFAAI